MAHGWDSYYNDFPPLPSDTETLRRIPDSDGTLSQDMENYIGQLNSSSTVAFPNTTVPPSNVNVNYCPNDDTGKLNSCNGCREDFNDGHWSPKGEQAEQLCPSSSVSEFTNGLKISSSGTFHGETQECERQATSMMENHTDVSNYSEYLSESDLSNYVASNLIPQVGNEPPEELGSSELLSPVGEKNSQDLKESIAQTAPNSNFYSPISDCENSLEEEFKQGTNHPSTNVGDKETHAERKSPIPNCTIFQSEDAEVKCLEEQFLMDSFKTSIPQSVANDVQENSPKKINHIEHADPCLLDSKPQMNKGVSQDTISMNMVEKLEGQSTCNTAAILSEFLSKSIDIPAFCPHTTEGEATYSKNDLGFQQAVKQKEDTESNFAPSSSDSPIATCDNSQIKLFELDRHLSKENVAHEAEHNTPQQKDDKRIIPEYKVSDDSNFSEHNGKFSSEQHEDNDSKSQDEAEEKIEKQTSTPSHPFFLNSSNVQSKNFEVNSLEDDVSINFQSKFPSKHAVEEDGPGGDHLEQSDSTTNSSCETTRSKDESSCMESSILSINSVSTVENESLPRHDCGITTDSQSTASQNILNLKENPCDEKEQMDALGKTYSTLQDENIDPDQNFTKQGESLVQGDSLTVQNPNFDKGNPREEAVSHEDSNTSAKSCLETECTGTQNNLTAFMSRDQQSLHDSPSQESSQSEASVPAAFSAVPSPLLCESQSEQGSRFTSETNVIPSLREHMELAKHEKDRKVTSQSQESEMKPLVQMKKAIHPVVILTAMESTEVRGSYSCANCHFTTDIVDRLIEHHHSSHLMDNIQFCKTCCFYQLKKESFEEHVCGVETKRPLSSNSIEDEKNIQFMQSQTVKGQFKCKRCGIYYASSSTLWRHKKFPGRCKRSLLFKCSPTNVATSSSYGPIQPCHVKLIDILKTTTCVLCDEKFPDVISLKKHSFTVHKLNTLSGSSTPSIEKNGDPNGHMAQNEAVGKHSCLLCPRVFKYSFNRNRHLRDCVRAIIYGGKMRVNGKYCCPLCEAIFATPQSRRRHIKCVCLKKSIAQATNFKVAHNQAARETKTENEHRPLTKNEELQSQQLPDDKETPFQQKLPPSDMVRRFKCNHCPAAFCHASGKYRHMKKHELFKLTGKAITYRNTLSSSAFINKSSTPQTEPSESGPESTETVSKTFTCKFCGKCFNSLKYKTSHERNHRGERPFQCLECGKRFKNIHHLNSHKTIHQRRIQCTVCTKIVSSISDLIQHRKQHAKRGMLQCPDCPMQFQYPVHLLRHVESHIKKENKASQAKQVGSSKPQELTESVEDNDAAQFECSICKDKFATAQVLRRHCLIHMSEPSSNRCPFCQNSFETCSNLLRHMIKHTRVKAPSGTKEVRRPVSLNTNNKPCSYYKRYSCTLCPRKFCKKDRLRKHLVAHKKKTLYLCSNCGQFFGINQIKHHQEECNQQAKDNVTVSTPDKVSSQMKQDKQKMVLQPKATNLLLMRCSYCSQTFRFKSLLDRHLVSHTGLLPYACTQCGNRYRSRSACVQHETFCSNAEKEELSKSQRDSKELKQPHFDGAPLNSQKDKRKEFKCKFCTKTFVKPRKLRNHILTHNEVKPYRCKACNSCFSRYDHLKVHQTQCNGEIRLEVRIPKVSLEDIGMGWKKRFGFASSEKNRFKCTNCSSTFAHEKGLKRHKKLRVCRRSSRKASVASLLGIEHSTRIGKKPHHVMKDQLLKRIPPYLKNHTFQCSYCPRSFPKHWQLRYHTRLHTGEKPFPCNHCGEPFARRDYIKRHLKKCTMFKKILCDRCGDHFPSSTFENHKKDCKVLLTPKSKVGELQETTKENGIQRFSCASCSYKCLIFSQLQEHFITAHKMETAAASGSSATLQHHLSKFIVEDKDENERFLEGISERTNLTCNLDFALDEISKYWCSICKISFPSKSELSVHKALHPRKLPYSCKKCKKGFWKKAPLQNHERKCRYKPTTGEESQESQAVAEKDSVLVFKDGSDYTGSGVLQTNFSCKDDSADQVPQDPEENQKSSSSQAKKTVHYQCSECDKSFTDGLLLISHLEDHGREEQARKHNICPRCGRVCANQINLLRHLKMHENAKQLSSFDGSKDDLKSLKLECKMEIGNTTRHYICKLCSQQFLTHKSLYTHYRKEHTDDVFSCKMCNKAYATKVSLLRHYRESHQKEARELSDVGQEEINYKQSSDQIYESGESDECHNFTGEDSDSDTAPYFPCHVCGKTFITSESLEDHQLCHLGKKPFECAECGKCFILASQLHQHQRMHKSEFQCQTCGRGFVTFFALRKHKHTHGKNRPHRCSKCQLSFKCVSQLAEHMSTHKEDNFPCDICERAFLSKTLRDEHRKSHASVTTEISRSDGHQRSFVVDTSSVVDRVLKYRCGVCSACFKDHDELSEHGCLKAGERLYSCLDCDKHFLHSSHLLKHKATHQLPMSNTEYSCNQCKVSFTSKEFLKHLKNHVEIDNSIKHESDDEDDGPLPTFLCPVCNQSFPSAAEVIPHFSSHFNVEREGGEQKLMYENEGQNPTPTLKFKCSQCNLSFSGIHGLHQHYCSIQKQRTLPSTANRSTHHPSMEDEVDVTGDESYACLPCSMLFTYKSSLLEHQNEHHSDKKPFKCEVCRKSFAKMSYLRKHQRRHGHPMIALTSPKRKTFECTRCKASFGLLHELNLHMRSHAEKEVGAFRCDMCYKSFGQLSQLRKHQESHVGEVVYECTECDKAFAFPHLLEEHRQSHGTSSQEG